MCQGAGCFPEERLVAWLSADGGGPLPAVTAAGSASATCASAGGSPSSSQHGGLLSSSAGTSTARANSEQNRAYRRFWRRT
jgi:hypothetical protein